MACGFRSFHLLVVVEMTEDHPRLHDGPLDPSTFLSTKPAASDGGQVLFVGTVRAHHDGRAVIAIRYHAHEILAERQLREIELEGAKKFGVRLQVAHAVGLLQVGDASVLVLACGGHRAQTFEGARWAIDTIKRCVPVWKEEHYADGQVAFQDGVPIEGVTS